MKGGMSDTCWLVQLSHGAVSQNYCCLYVGLKLNSQHSCLVLCMLQQQHPYTMAGTVDIYFTVTQQIHRMDALS